MGQLKRIIDGHDLAAGGEMALKSALVLANRCDAVLRLVHVVEPLEPYHAGEELFWPVVFFHVLDLNPS